MSLVTIIGIGFLVALAICGFMTFAGIGDVPENRSSHQRVTPTGGGVGIIAAIGIGAFLLSRGNLLSPDFAQILALIWGVSFLGLMDDIYNLAPKLKFLVLALMSGAAVWVIGPVLELPFGRASYELQPWFGWAGSLLWIFVVTNIVNFMDGSNGLMLVVMGIASGVLAWISYAVGATQTTLLLLILMAGMAGLAPYNFGNKARLFSGDVGSLTIGFVYGVAVLWLCREASTQSPVYIGPVLIMPFLADALFTMARRLKHKENLLQAHNSHLYQRMIKSGLSHRLVAVIYGGATLILAGLTIWAIGHGLHRFMNFILVPVFLMMSIYMIAGRKFS